MVVAEWQFRDEAIYFSFMDWTGIAAVFTRIVMSFGALVFLDEIVASGQVLLSSEFFSVRD